VTGNDGSLQKRDTGHHCTPWTFSEERESVVCVYVCVRKRERESVCGWVGMCVCMYVCVRVCVMSPGGQELVRLCGLSWTHAQVPGNDGKEHTRDTGHHGMTLLDFAQCDIVKSCKLSIEEVTLKPRVLNRHHQVTISRRELERSELHQILTLAPIRSDEDITLAPM